MRRVLRAVLVCGAVAACEHPGPYAVEAVPPNPLTTGSIRQLTFNPEGEWAPAWTPDGSAIGFSWQPPERSDRDRCLAFIPAEGGRIVRQICVRAGHETDSVNVVSTHGVSLGGRLALVAESGNPRNIIPDRRGLYLGRLDSGALRRVIDFPYTAPSGLLHQSASDLTWVDESTLVYLATFINYRFGNLNFPPDTVATGMELVRLDLVGDSIAALTVLPGTLGASSVSSGPADSVYYTMGGDSRVFALDVRTGQSTVVYDFGALGIAREAQVRGSRLTAIVGGRVRFFPFDSAYGIPYQADSGGPVVAVNLQSGPPQVVAQVSQAAVPGSRVYRYLSASPSGRQVVAETYTLIVRVLRFTTDTVISKRSDLWLIDVP